MASNPGHSPGSHSTRRAWLRGALALLAWAQSERWRLRANEQHPTFVVMIDGSREYHAPACVLVRDNATARLLPFGDAEAKGIRPHPDCHTPPDRTPASAGGAAGKGAKGGAGAGTAAATYWLDVKTRRYHRPGCGLIGLPRVQVTLARAIEQKYLACRSCRPETGPPPADVKKAPARARTPPLPDTAR